jgi:hypothetical protein
MESYITSIKKQFLYYKSLGEKAMDQLSEQDLFWRYNDASNSIAIIIAHLSGNMRSRFSDFLTTDGEKPWRDRDREFEDIPASGAEIRKVWDEGWATLFAAIDTLKVGDLESIIYIRNDGHTVVEALNRQLAHYPYHIGQMIFIAKMLKGDQWQTLSIAKNHSGNYNSKKFSIAKDKRHFTDDF